jgi:hypothetical protein
MVTVRPASSSNARSSAAIVDLPEPLSPVNHTQAPLGWRDACVVLLSPRIADPGW